MDDKRLIEDYLPIHAVSMAAVREPRTKGHISTLHIWRARRPLVACRAAIYGALVPADHFAPQNGPENKKHSLARANAAKFVKSLCVYPGSPKIIADAEKHILDHHARQKSMDGGEPATEDDILSGQTDRPKVLDIFSGGGAIPLEAARLGCESHAVEINPVAHLIELCTTTFPQTFGSSLADEVEKWADIVLERTKTAVSDLLVNLPKPVKKGGHKQQSFKETHSGKALSIVAHYWTRTVECPNPVCGGAVPMYRQTWLRKKASGYVALKPVPDHGRKVVNFEVVASDSEQGFDFDPGSGSRSSSTVCPFCQASVDGKYVRNYGNTVGYGQQLMCVICLNPEGRGKLYIAGPELAAGEEERQEIAEQRAAEFEKDIAYSSLNEMIPPTGNAGLATGKSYLYGIVRFRDMFTSRQRYIMGVMTKEIRNAYGEMMAQGVSVGRSKAITTYLGLWLSRIIDRFNALARWDNSGEKTQGLTSMKRYAMAWDYPEVNIFGGASGDAWGGLEYLTSAIRAEAVFRNPAICSRGSATALPFENEYFDAVITDPPYYDNESYSELSDVCYVWLRAALSDVYPEHFAGRLTPKKKECVAAAYRQGGTVEAAKTFYENCLFQSLKEAHRVTKPGGILTIVYAHKTTLGWATLVEALRRAGYEVTQAWPIETETRARVAHHGDAALASSIFLVARKRHSRGAGSYENDVRPALNEIVRERVATLWQQGISGADLVIACVGAGLRAFTRFSTVEYANGETVPAERFLSEVETVVLETILHRLSKEVGANGGRYSLAGLDNPTRFYILWRYTYRWTDLEAGEAIIFANGTHVELDGHESLSSGPRVLVEKVKGKYRLKDFQTRGADEKLGQPIGDGFPAPMVDALHRTLWLMEKRPRELAAFLRDSGVNREQMKLVAQALAGPALKGGELGEVSPSNELTALARLTANWKSVIENAELPPSDVKRRNKGQLDIFS